MELCLHFAIRLHGAVLNDGARELVIDCNFVAYTFIGLSKNIFRFDIEF
jgi:hypothetical protein